MAKKHHHKKRTHRRVGAMHLDGNNPLLKLAAAGLGYLAADTINPMVDKIVKPTATNQTMVGAGQAGVGTLALLNKKGSKTVRLLTTVGGGLVAGSGVKRLMKATGMISGYQQVPVLGGRGRQGVNGYQQVPVIGMPPQLQGMTPAQLQGYRVNGYRVNGSMHPGAAAAQPSGVSYRD